MVDAQALAHLDQPGRGPAAIFVHGFCQSSAYWGPTLARLGGLGRRGLAPDLPGFGASARARGPYTMEGYADRLAAWLDGLDLDRVAVVGGAMGSVVAQHFALRHPGRLDRLVLVATGATLDDPAAAATRADVLAAAPWTLETMRPIVELFFHRRVADEVRDAYERIALMASREAGVSAARSNAASDTTARLAEIGVPALIVQGRHDRIRTPAHGNRMVQLMPRARLVVLDASSHTPQIEEPDAFHAVVLPFLGASG